MAVATYVLIFLATRLINLKSFPVFGDETSYILYARSTVNGDLFAGLRASLRLTHIWLIVISLQLFSDPLLAARVVSVLSGLIGGGVYYKLAVMLYPGRRIGYTAALFYLLCPFALFYDRMAVTDSLLTMLIGISLILSVQLWQAPSVKWSLALGVAFGLATLTKAYAALYYATPILLWLFLGRKISWSRIAKLMTIVYTVTLLAWLPTFIVAQGITENSISHLTITTSSKAGFFEFFWDNLLLAAEWLSAYLTLPVAGFLIVMMVMVILKRDKLGFIMTILLGGHLVFFTIAFTRWYPRYLLPTIVPISVIFARGIDYLVQVTFSLIEKISHKSIRSSVSNLVLQGTIFLVLFMPALLFDYLIITAPIRAPFPVIDKWQYFGGPYAGYGLKESARFIEQMTEQYPKLTVLTGPHSLDIHGMSLYLLDSEKVSIETINDFDVNAIRRLDTYAREGPTLTIRTSDVNNNDSEFLLPDGSRHPQAWQIAYFPKPSFQTEFESYEWLRLPNSLRQDALSTLQMEIDLYQWVLPPDFAIRWFQQGGDSDPRIAWHASDTLVTATGGVLLDWSQIPASTSEGLPQSLTAANVEYVLATPELISHQPGLFAPFMATDGERLRLSQLPPGWWLAFVYPDINCQWCLFQLRPPEHPTQVIFGERIELTGYDVSATALSPGDSLHITLYWSSLGPLPESYLIFVHLLDTNGSLVGQVDELPFQGKWLTNQWRAGDRLADRHTLRLDPTLPRGDYTILVGLYNPADLERMPAYAEQNPVLDNAVTLTTLSIQ